MSILLAHSCQLPCLRQLPDLFNNVVVFFGFSSRVVGRPVFISCVEDLVSQTKADKSTLLFLHQGSIEKGDKKQTPWNDYLQTYG